MTTTTPPVSPAPGPRPMPAKPRMAHTPTVLQMESVECGAASLSMILQYHKCYVPLPELRQACGVSRDGSKASNVLRAARGYGLESKGFKKSLEEVFELKPPFIAFWNFNHFLVVEGWDKKLVHLNDPGGGQRRMPLEEFDAGYTGVVLTFTPTAEFKKGGLAPQLLPKLKERLSTSSQEMLYATVAGLLLVVPSLAGPVFTQVFVDDVLVKGFSDWLRPLLLGMLLAALVTAGLRYLQLRVQSALKTKLAISMSGEFLWHLLRLPVSFYGQRFAGEIAGRMSIADAAASILGGSVATSFLDAFMLLFYACAMLAYDPVLALIAIVMVSINFTAVKVISKRQERVYVKTSLDQGKASGVSIAGLQSIETLKASGLEGDFFSRWSGYYTRGVNSQQGNLVSGQILGAMPTMLATLSGLCIMIVGGFRVIDGHLSIGTLVGFQALMGSFMGPVGRLLGLGTALTQLKADLGRLDDVLGTAVDPGARPTDLASVPAGMAVRLTGRVELRNVTFGYSAAEPPLIENLSLVLEPGQRVAFVGGSGSGKSTVAKLIMGLFEPWSGEILFDGKPRVEIPRAVMNQSLAMVDQDLFLFSASVRENISLWDGTMPDADIMRACADADILDIITALPGGLDSELKEGASNLSGGQRQRIEIARALSRDPAILVLDEATSALDSESEQVVDRHLRKRGCTCVMVAHRLSTIRDCDEIIVLDRGKVTQRGPHDQLKREDGHYSALIRAEGGVLEETHA
jgi:ATP-binding cassette subfamily C protein